MSAVGGEQAKRLSVGGKDAEVALVEREHIVILCRVARTAIDASARLTPRSARRSMIARAARSGTGSGRMTTRFAASRISSAGMPTRCACMRIASASLAW
jgi:hypothetical protein